MALRIVFFGTAELARVSLAALASDASFEIAAVVSQPDREKGRDLKLQPPPVKTEAVARGFKRLAITGTLADRQRGLSGCGDGAGTGLHAANAGGGDEINRIIIEELVCGVFRIELSET